MELAQLIDALTQPAAYPAPAPTVEVRQTHISVVFLAGNDVYKIKKPVQFPFLDFSTLERRRHFCEEEVRLNRRLAEHVYKGVVPITHESRRLQIGGAGPVVEWAVHMTRLPDEASLLHRVQHNQIGDAEMTALAHRIAAFHAQAESGDRVAAFGRFDVVARNARENFEQTAAHVGVTVERAVFERVRTLTEEHLSRWRGLIEERAALGRMRDTHGDLRLGHVYLFPDEPPPNDLVVIDCIEFNERFRCADPVSDIAFLALGLIHEGRRDLARTFVDAYFQASGDDSGRALVPYYTAYRALIRAKVDGLMLAEAEIPAAGKAEALAKARSYWLLAMAELAPPLEKPCLVLVAGLPGSGKSTLARMLTAQAGFELVRSDVVRKELATAAVQHPETSGFEAGIYSAEWTERTYAECLRRVEMLLTQGKRVLVDANFRTEDRRSPFRDVALRCGVASVLFVCRVAPEVAQQRLAQRRGDASDADWAVRQRLAQGWQEPHDDAHALDANGSADVTYASAWKVLQDAELA